MSGWYLDTPGHVPSHRLKRRREEKDKRKVMLLGKGWKRIEDSKKREHWISPYTGIRYNYLNAKNIEELRISLNRKDYL